MDPALMTTFKKNRENHKAFFSALAELCGNHGVRIEPGGVVFFCDGLVDPDAKAGSEAETTARYLIHQVDGDGADVEALEYNFHVQGVDVEVFKPETPPDCNHPWHNNPALITPCPACGESDDE